jgi:hypothetical protein
VHRNLARKGVAFIRLYGEPLCVVFEFNDTPVFIMKI